MYTRTTLRIEESLKKSAEKKALEMDVSLQDVFNEALAHYLEREAQREAKKIVFKTHDLGTPLDNLQRSDYYSD